MRMKLLEGNDGAGVLLVYPATRNEYDEALERLGRPAALTGGPSERGPAHAAYVVTTAAQRERWDLLDLAAFGRARMVDEADALGLLCDGANRAVGADKPLAGAAAETAGEPPDAARASTAARARVDEVLGSLDGVDLPRPVRESLRADLCQVVAAEERALDDAASRARQVLSLPWRRRQPERFDAAAVAQALRRTHGGLERVIPRLVDVLAACPQTRGPLTVEGPRRGGAATGAPALVVRPGAAGVPCLTGPAGTGKTSLAVAVAHALGRPHVRVPLGGTDLERLLCGRAAAPGRIVEGLGETGVSNPVFILEGVDRVDPKAADALLDILDPEHRTAFRDRYVVSPFDLSSVLWLVTATAPEAIPESVRPRLELIELAGYGEDEKLEIAQRHLLARPFDGSGPAGRLSPEPASPAGPDRAAAPAVAVDGAAVPVRDLARWSAGVPAGAAETWRTAASAGHVRFEDDAVRLLIRAHTDEAGVAELGAKLAAVCREVVRRRLPGATRPAVVTPAVVREVLGEGAGEPLPPAVRAAVARERRRLADKSEGGSAPTNDWIDCLEKLPWTRCSEAPIDLAQARAALDADHAGLDDAKACILEHLAVRRRNPRGSGAAICLVGPPSRVS